MKKILFFCICILCFTSIRGQDTREGITHTQYSLAINSYAYLLGMEMSVMAAIKQLPHSSNEIRKSSMRFDRKFGGSKNNIYEFLNNNAPQYKKQTDSLFQSVRSSLKFNHTDAMSLIADLDRRAMFNIDEPFLSTLSYFQFNGDYREEFNTGHTYTYSSKDSKKAKGMNISLKLPISWRSHEGDRPNIVQKFTPVFDNRSIVCILQINTNEQGSSFEDVCKAEEHEILKRGDWILNKYEITIDRCEGFFLEFRHSGKRLQYDINMINRVYIFQYNSKICYLHIGIHSPDDSVNFDKYKPICDLIAGSVVVNNQWTK